METGPLRVATSVPGCSEISWTGMWQFFWNGLQALGLFWTVTYGNVPLTDKRINEADYYRACAADMMAKAQAAPSKAIRVAYLNLARIWGRKADVLEKEWLQAPTGLQPGAPSSVQTVQKG